MIRITKIDWTDFIPYSKYRELEEENKRLEEEAKKWKQKYDKLKYQIKISDLCDENL